MTFHQDTDGVTTFNDVFGAGSPTLTFNSDNALAAAQDLLAAINAADFDPTPGSSSINAIGFVLPFAYTATTLSWDISWRNTPGNGFSGTFGPFTQSRDTNFGFGFATFAPVNVSAVPEPATIALLGLAFAGLAATRRRKL